MGVIFKWQNWYSKSTGNFGAVLRKLYEVVFFNNRGVRIGNVLYNLNIQSAIFYFQSNLKLESVINFS